MRIMKSAKVSKSTLINKFSALGDSTRFRLLELLIDNEDYCVSELASEVGISNAGVSQQLKILEQAGIVNRVRMGQKICYALRADDEIVQKLANVNTNIPL